MKTEQKHFKKCRKLIEENINYYEMQIEAGRKETKELFSAVASGNTELYAQLIVSENIQEHNEKQLRRNRAALQKPYFGRIDYREIQSEQMEILYIGKNGVSKNKTEVIIVDWRAPVAALYYENELGTGQYTVSEVGSIEVDLGLKRTFDINDGILQGFYDNDTVATDELLVKYLSQNKDVVLGDIISTIQKEQNEIIRQMPFHNTIVQGVAGSGKTTVCMHRISYILYNYEKRFLANEFCIIGSNDMLLNYITSGLPELDVHNVKQKRMDQLFVDFLGTEWKKKYKKIDIKKTEAFKSQIPFVKELDLYLRKVREELLIGKKVEDHQIGILLSEESIYNSLMENQGKSIIQICKLLNDRIHSRIQSLIAEEDKEFCRQKQREYKGYFKQGAGDKDIIKIYADFLKEYENIYGINTTDVQKHIKEYAFDVYDIATLAFIRSCITEKRTYDDYSQIFIDEAQDFGSMVYYVLRKILKGCYFTLMGDVSQNINYETGMNHWDDLTEHVFGQDVTNFHILSKSYRNTIEISEYAGRILDKASFGRYKIEPVIRHGREVLIHQVKERDIMMQTVALAVGMQEQGYGTVAIICRDFEVAKNLEDEMAPYVNLDKTTNFQKGIMVLPIHLTKGLEFDGVILFNPSPEDYPDTEGDAKLLYVAVTRALHELHIIYNHELSKLLFQL